MFLYVFFNECLYSTLLSANWQGFLPLSLSLDLKMSVSSHTHASFESLSLVVLGCAYTLILVDSLYKTFRSVWPGLADMRLRVHYVQILSVVICKV